MHLTALVSVNLLGLVKHSSVIYKESFYRLKMYALLFVVNRNLECMGTLEHKILFENLHKPLDMFTSLHH